MMGFPDGQGGRRNPPPSGVETKEVETLERERHVATERDGEVPPERR